MQRVPVFVILILLITCTVHSQDYRISNYGNNEGISHPFVYTINQDSKGYIWAGTGEGLCRFNGFTFSTDPSLDTLAGQVAGVSFKDSRNILWFGYQSGDLVRYDGTSFSIIRSENIQGAITGIAELAEGGMLITTLNNGVYSLAPNSEELKPTEGLPVSNYTTLLVKGNTLILGAIEGLSVCSIDNNGTHAAVRVNIREFEFTRINDIQPSFVKNTFWIATEDMGAFRLTLNGELYTLQQAGTEFKLEKENAQAVFEDQNRDLWISSLRNGIFKLINPDQKGEFETFIHYDKKNGLPGNAIKKVFQDFEGNVWVATYGDGISILTGQPMIFTDFEVAGIENDIQAVVVAGDTYFIGGPGGLFKFVKGRDKAPVKITGVPSTGITALKMDGKRLLIGTEADGLYYLESGSNTARKVIYEAYSMGNYVTSIATDQKHVFLGTKDGVYQFGKNLDAQAHYTTTNGMPHNNIEQIFIDNQNRLLVASRAPGIYTISEEGEITNLFPTEREVDIKSITQDGNGNIWAATYGDGVLFFTKDSIYQFMEPAGLKANFCYSIAYDNKGSVWVGHRMGISRINTGNSLISVYDQHTGVSGDCNYNAIFTSDNGNIHFGTTAGLISYDPSRESKTPLPPFTNIVSLLISDKPYDFNNPIVLPYKLYRLRIEFIGLNYSDPQAVRYQYKLEGYDLDWSDVTTQTSISYPRIEDGEYTFYVRSYNNEGLSQEIPVSFTIRVKPPIWKRWWFIALCFVALAFAFFFILKVRERKQKQLQEYLERELTARTKEVVEQKEEIEIKNRDITDSINYAKRIQTSMLPPIKRLQHHFSGSFVFYSPRDIVSGDFYWFDIVSETKFVIVCADSTGHGVPGAFMSMIGSTLIKDICNRETGNSPSKVLQVLDCELRNTLNQNLDDGTKPGDGMDIIVCEIDLQTHYVRYASAMRPMIIYRNGEEIFVKGSRNSVGGHYDKADNLFEDEGLQLSKGDIIYMFSDGYSDQFGGPMGKKFKMVRLKNLLQDIHTKPMDEQCLHVKNTFNLWKENYEQVDDVLFMGIKI